MGFFVQVKSHILPEIRFLHPRPAIWRPSSSMGIYKRMTQAFASSVPLFYFKDSFSLLPFLRSGILLPAAPTTAAVSLGSIYSIALLLQGNRLCNQAVALSDGFT